MSEKREFFRCKVSSTDKHAFAVYIFIPLLTSISLLNNRLARLKEFDEFNFFHILLHVCEAISNVFFSHIFFVKNLIDR